MKDGGKLLQIQLRDRFWYAFLLTDFNQFCTASWRKIYNIELCDLLQHASFKGKLVLLRPTTEVLFFL